MPFSLPVQGWRDLDIYCGLLDCKYLTVDNAFFSELTIFQDFSQNSLKRKRYDALRARLRSKVEPDGGNDIVYLSRGRTGVTRVVENEDELIHALEREGVRVLNLETDSVMAILSALRGARIFVTMEGSQFIHGLYSLPDRAAVVLLQPPRRFMMILKGFADCLGWPFGILVGEDRGEASFYVNPDEVLRTIDEMQKRV